MSSPTQKSSPLLSSAGMGDFQLKRRPSSPQLPLDPPSQLTRSLKFQPSKRGGQSYWTSGRPPWYNQKGSLQQPFIIGIAGGTSSGKTTVCHRIVEELNIPWAVLLSQDSFYKSLDGEDLEKASRSEYNFDHPDAFDYDLLFDTLRRLKKGQIVHVPIYDFKTHKRVNSQKILYGADVILFEGILAFYSQDLLDLMDMKIFVDADSDTRLARRLRRDIAERGRDLSYVLKQYTTFVKPSYDEYIAPTKANADIIIPNGSDSKVAIDLIVQHIKLKLQQRGVDLRDRLLNQYKNDEKNPDNLYIMPSTPQIRGMHTKLRNYQTSRDDFIFLTTRITRLLIEHALSFLPSTPASITTPTGWTYNGITMDPNICGVSIMRAGESMELALREVVKDVRIGKILIQSNPKTNEPEMIYCKLPATIENKIVFLMDPMIGTGATALMAIRVLLDHYVKEENIYFLNLISTPTGIHNIAYAYPNVKIICTSTEDRVNDQYFILPGVGNFGDRYYGTEGEDDYQEDEDEDEGNILLLPPRMKNEVNIRETKL